MYKTKEELSILQQLYDNGGLDPTGKEKLVINPKIAYYVTDDDIKNSIPDTNTLKKVEHVYGKLSRFSTDYTPVSNLIWDYLFFTNSSLFAPAGNAFTKSMKSVAGTNIKPKYTSHLPGTISYDKFWAEEFNRISNGYEPIIDGKPCGLKVTGEHYFYLNYGWIKKIEVDKNGNVIKDDSGMPDFLSMDYYFYKEVSARENPSLYNLEGSYKQSLTVVKSRRKGFSYKAACGAVWITAFNNNAKVLIASSTGKDATLCYKKSLQVIDHISRYTPFGRKATGNPRTNGGWKHITLTNTTDKGLFTFGLQSTKTGERLGRLSVIETASLNKDDAASGEGLSRLYIEEAGKVNNLLKAWGFSEQSMKVGSVYRGGIAIIFGTGGSMVSDSGKKGSSKDLSLLHQRPESNGIAGFDNIYDYKPSKVKCGFFVSDMWYNPGSYCIINGERLQGLDSNGNPIFWIAEMHLNKERSSQKPPNGTKASYELTLTQRCKTPSEAFLVTQGSRFQTEDILERRLQITTSRLGYNGLRLPGELVERDGEIVFISKPDLEPLTDDTSSNREGCLLRYEPPLRVGGVIEAGSYIISVDPIGIDTNDGGSCTAIIVYKTSMYEQFIGKEKVVATYFGRKSVNPQGYVHRLLMKLSKYYNALITVENDRDGGIIQYFIRKGELNRLMSSPISVMEKFIPNSKTTNRKFGHSMSSVRHKQIGEDLLYEWLDKRGSDEIHYDTDDGEKIITEGVTNIERLEDQVLIEQLINYERGGNYDMVMAMMGIIMQIKEHYDPEMIQYKDESLDAELKSWYDNLYNN